MRSGNGRHRRPRQVPAIVVTAGVTGSALALPLLAATSASAADTSTWDKVAECESGGTWSANFGSGAYGGLQFTQEEWREAGGLDFAERADLASRSQQIAVAERVLAARGPQAWPMCAAPAGLDAQGPAAVVDPGLPGKHGAIAPTPSRPDDKVPPAGSGDPATDFGAPTPAPHPLGPDLGLPVMPPPDLPTPDPTVPVTPTPDPTAPGNSGQPVDPGVPTTPPTTPPATPPVTPGLPPVTPGDPADPGVPAAPDASTAPPVAPGEGSGKHRGTPATEAPVTSDAASAPSYTVKAGDSLMAIADAKGLKGGWNALYAANEQVIGEDANLIKPGQNLDLTAQ
ncbi:transglycosylase family protein [Streptomyces sp. NBC_01351]|uniref:transglycosylase family protein n=1 Tax=Streptomyces sp. NBC_01351 TaxID=2903833 RepID=UPI002E2F163B|nr:transglycosylase family protein [Streptomyces sp. NBC_01351]